MPGANTLLSMWVAKHGSGAQSVRGLPNRIWRQQYRHAKTYEPTMKAPSATLRINDHGLIARTSVKASHMPRSEFFRLYVRNTSAVLEVRGIEAVSSQSIPRLLDWTLFGWGARTRAGVSRRCTLRCVRLTHVRGVGGSKSI